MTSVFDAHFNAGHDRGRNDERADVLAFLKAMQATSEGAEGHFVRASTIADMILAITALRHVGADEAEQERQEKAP